MHLGFTSQRGCFLTQKQAGTAETAEDNILMAKVMSGNPRNFCKMNHCFLQKKEKKMVDIGKSIENLPFDWQLEAGRTLEV